MAEPDVQSTRNTGQSPLAGELLAADTFEHLVADCTTLVASEINGKGMTMRTVFKLVQKAKPDILERTVRELMPEFVYAIEPCYAGYQAQSEQNLRDYLVAHDAEIARAMLTVTDRRAARIQRRTIGSGYDRVRDRAQQEMIDAMPRIATIIARHA